MPSADSRSSAPTEGRALLSWLCWAPLLVISIAHAAFVFIYATDVPHLDEWEALVPNALGRELNFHWLFAFHNEHRIVWTNLLTWLLYRLDGWNLAWQIRLNFLIFLGLIGLLLRLKNRTLGPARFSGFPLFMAFLVSTIAWQNHSWGFQSQFHFVLIFTITAVMQSNPWLMLLLLVCGMFSLSCGVPAALAVVMVSGLRTGRFTRIAPVWAAFLASAALWFVHYEKNPGHLALTLPYMTEFWSYFFRLVGKGFGFVKPLPGEMIGMAVLAFYVYVLTRVFKMHRSKNAIDDSVWSWFALMTAILAMLATISMGRARFNILESRYAEIAFLLIPAVVCQIYLLIPNREMLRTTILTGVFALSVIGYSDEFQFGTYRWVAQQRTEDLKCIRDYFAGRNDGSCPGQYLGPIGDRLARAKQLHVSFTDPLP